MGLGLHSGGLESARYLALGGADVTVTDLQDEKTLAPSIAGLEESGKRIRYVLGRHEMEDFSRADMVVKNPGVKIDSPYLAAAKRIETDISLFLAGAGAIRLSAVTGSKGKSSTASALQWILEAAGRPSFLGGNITVSPLSFLNRLEPGCDVALELSSWQLGDLALCGAAIKPRVAVVTAILPDHLDRYESMEAYVADKRLICRHQDRSDALISAADDRWGFFSQSAARPLPCFAAPPEGSAAGGWLDENGRGLVRLRDGDEVLELLPPRTKSPGRHQKQNLLAAAMAACELGVAPAVIRGALGNFPGIEHRLEWFYEKDGVTFYNDSAATIPEAAAAAIGALPAPVAVCGGTDKNLDFRPLAEAAKKAAALILLEGTGSDKLIPLLRADGVPFRGPYGDLERAVEAAFQAAKPGNSVVLSPGCASFGMFLNEFDRGRRWKAAVLKAAGGGS
ncbi:MAG: UDP-N-acetylmuramoyl-L-alanine--D-glutamate ligase [Treponema sp.]|nr:UDP-N-acetylmuramoyl-L-alanine--D-glutamate ligase [Treponema sp.]